MRDLGMDVVRRGRKLRATIPGRDGSRVGDLLDRDFTAEGESRGVVGFEAQRRGCVK